MTETIPGPPGLPFLGNLLDIRNADGVVRGLEQLAEIYGPIYQIQFGPNKRIVCSSAELLAELTDESQFVKVPATAISHREGPQGLFSATNDHPDWGQAHRILTPAFGPLPVESMFEGMKDIANQLVLKWARKDPETPILITDDFTRLTLDTIALCSMDFRFNSFYQDSMHPFVDAMLLSLAEAGNRVTRPAILTKLMYKTNASFDKAQELVRATSQKIIENRRANPLEKKDLLNAMLYGKDPKTGEVMRDELIGAEMTTFLIAGHETTSGLLSFVFFNLLKNPRTYLEAQKEVDEVIGKGPITVEHLKKLKYINAVLRETSRLYPTAPVIHKKRNPKLGNMPYTLGGGKYMLEPDDGIMILLGRSQRDAKVYGEDALEFKPERMFDDAFNKYPDGTWRPFGNGVRACIGKGFAWQEALLVVAILLQNFDVQLGDPAYRLHIKQNLTVKPKDLYVKAKLRNGITPTDLDQMLHNYVEIVKPAKLDINTDAFSSAPTKAMTILYGSNTGTCQALAQRLAAEAAAHGFAPDVMDMDSANGKLPITGLLVIITASYEGQPPENAARFVQWLQADPGILKDVQYAVFGCGHRDWVKTFHRIPRLMDEKLAERGAHRLAPIGLTDVAKSDIFGDFDNWLDGSFWPKVAGDPGDFITDTTADVDISTSARASSLRQDISLGKVIGVMKLTAEGEPVKLHMDVQLPTGSSYECGDYLAVLPMNPDKIVRRVLSHFQLPWDAVITLKGSTHAIIPSGIALSIYDVLRSYVELSQPVTKKDLKRCVRCTQESTEAQILHDLWNDPSLFESEILGKRTSLLDILMRYKSIALPFGDFLVSLPPMRIRQYSISSSPLEDPERCSITFSVIDRPSLSDPDVSFEGVASTYLSSLQAGDSVQVSIRPTSKKTFRLPLDPKTPLLMYCAGTGLAPFRGFIQQRAIQLKANPERKLAPAVIFIGCRSQEKDRLFARELDGWRKMGAIEVQYAFSREADRSHGCAYVADRMIREKDTIVSMWYNGARAYVCGSRAFSKTVGEAARKILSEAREVEDNDEGREQLQEWFKRNLQERIATDIFD